MYIHAYTCFKGVISEKLEKMFMLCGKISVNIQKDRFDCIIKIHDTK